MPGVQGRSRTILLVALAAAAALAPTLGPATAHARAFRPPHGRAYHGVSGTVGRFRDFERFRRRVRAHPAVLEDFFPWGTHLNRALPLWHRTRTRGMLSLTTKLGDREVIRPGQIAKGRGDPYILRLNRSIAASHLVVYIRLFPEMNGFWNPYAAFNSDGSARGPGHSTKSFRRAWRRFAIVIRGGSVARINRRLGTIGLPPLRAKHARKRLPRPRVAMVWNPQTISNPAIGANGPSRYWPGRHYVDWVGADIYSKFATPGVRAALTRFYFAHRGLPFEIGEYSPWDSDPHGAFVRWLFHWAAEHGRAELLVYYRSVYGNGPYDISRYPGAENVLRKELDSKRFMQYPPSPKKHHHHHGGGHHHHRHRRHHH